MSVQKNTWTLVTELLREAQAELARAPGSSDESDKTGQSPVAQFEMFLAANELELAWDALADLASTSAPAQFWDKMLVSAGLMSLAPQANLAATRLYHSRAHAGQA